jgi:hypothetical protein
MFCTPGLVFDGTEGVGSRFHVLRSQTSFRRCRLRRVPFSCFERPASFSVEPRASGPVFIFCASGLVFGGTEGVGSRFHILRVGTSFWRYRGRRVPFSYFALRDTFSAVRMASGPVFMFCAPGHVFDGTDGVGSRFRQFRGCWVPFSCFVLPESFPTVPRASGLVFMFCAPELIFGGTEGVGSRFHVLCSRTSFRWCRVRQAHFSCFARPD